MDSVLWVNRNQTILIVTKFIYGTYSFLSDTYLSGIAISGTSYAIGIPTTGQARTAGENGYWFRKNTRYYFRENSDELRIDWPGAHHMLKKVGNED